MGLLRLVSWLSTLLGIIFAVWGICACFFGYRLIRVAFAVFGFLIGIIVGSILAGYADAGKALFVLLFFGFGALTAYLAFKFYFIGYFLIGSFGVVSLMEYIGSLMDVEPSGLSMLGPAIAGGVIALIYERPVIIASTAVHGATVLVHGIAFIFNVQLMALAALFFPEEFAERLSLFAIILPAAWVVLVIAGIIVQSKFTAARRRRVRNYD